MTNIFWKTSSIIPTISSTLHNFYILILSQPFLTVLYLKIQKSHFPFSAQLRSSSAKNLLVLTIPPATQAKLHCAAVIKCCETATETGIPQIQRAVRVPFDFDDKCRRLCLLKKRWTQVVTFLSVNSKSAMKKDCDHVSSPFFGLIYNATWPKR